MARLFILIGKNYSALKCFVYRCYLFFIFSLFLICLALAFLSLICVQKVLCCVRIFIVERCYLCVYVSMCCSSVTFFFDWPKKYNVAWPCLVIGEKETLFH